MIKKQQALNVHFIPCDKLTQRFQMLGYNSITQDIDQTEFCAILASSKLLKADFPAKDERWGRFYSKFIVMDQSDQSGPSRKRYSLAPTQIALIFLAQGSVQVKARAICELYTDAQFINPSPISIKDRKKFSERPQERLSRDDQLHDTNLNKDQLRCIISIFVNISLVLLPMYASDFP